MHARIVNAMCVSFIFFNSLYVYRLKHWFLSRGVDMSIVYDICVVGAGLVGSATAYHASAKPGLKVCLIGPQEPKVRIIGLLSCQPRVTVT